METAWTSSPETSPLRNLVRSQVRLSFRFDQLLPIEFRVDGNDDFCEEIIPRYLHPGAVVYDVGGGKNPVIDPRLKAELGLKTVGIDIDAAELAIAPPGAYDDTICADIARYRGRADGDLVICQALLEHVRDVEEAIAAIASVLKPGGRALIFVPSRNALYARLNLMLPEPVKRRILYSIFPETRRDHGFPAFYDQCTPADFERLGRRHGLARELRRLYFTSSYFRFCLPLHAAWRLWMLAFRQIAGIQSAETFAVVFRKEQ